MNWFDNLKIKAKLLLVISIVLLFSGLIQAYFSLKKEEARLEAMYSQRAHDIINPIVLKVIETMMVRTDETVTVFENWLVEMSKTTPGAKFWAVWSQPLIDEHKDQPDVEAELPRDEIDNEGIANGEIISRKRWNSELGEYEYRVTVPVVLGVGRADNELCFTCHEAMGIKRGETIGAISTAISMKEGLEKYADLRWSIVRDTVVLFLVLIAIISFFITKHVLSPINEVTAMLRGLAEEKGSLKQLPYAKKDEIGELAGWFNTFVRRLSDLFGVVLKTVDQIASASEELSASAAQTSRGSVTQSDETGKMASAMEEMTASSKEMTDNANHAFKGAGKVQETAARGADTVNKAVLSMSQISSSMSDASQRIRELNKHSEKINEIINIILDIADQTNLLSLNAAIEAARAGEAGRGFAVVADEVRKLAERTAAATRDITSVINTMQAGTGTTTKTIEEMAQKVSEGVLLINQSGTSLKEIIDGINGTSSDIGQIAFAAREQSKAVEDTARNIDSINNVTKQLAAGAREVLSSATFLSKLSAELKDEMDTIRTDI